jgi:tetratricopeptide (TPR) repeat protein
MAKNIGWIILFFCLHTQAQEILKEKIMSDEMESQYFYAFTEATKYMIYQNYEQAISLYTKCLEYNPGSAAIKYQLSVIFYRLGNNNESKKYGKEALLIEPKNKWYLINLLNLYQMTNQFDSAIILTKDLIRLYPEKPENYFNLVRLYDVKGYYSKALEILDYLESEYGRSTEVYINKYSVYRDMRNTKKAIYYLMQANALDTENSNITGLIAEIYRDLGIKDSAAKYYDLLLRKSEGNPLSVFSYIEYLVGFKYNEKAIVFFTTAINNKTIEKEQIISYFVSKGDNLEQLGNESPFYDTAMEFINARFIDDQQVNSFYINYNILRKKFFKAEEILKQWIGKYRDNPKLWEQLLYVENQMNNYDSVIKYGNEALRNFLQYDFPYLYMGIAYRQVKKNDEAIKILEKGLNFGNDKDNLLQYYLLIGENYNDIGNFEKTIEFYEKALLIDSTNNMIKNNLAYYFAVADINLERAEKLSKSTIIAEERNYIYIDTYAWIMFKMNRIKDAKYFIKKAYKFGGKSDNDIVNHYNLIFGNKSE